MGFGTGGRGSSVELPLDHVDRDVECVRSQDHGDPEGVAIPKEGQQVIGASLGHHRYARRSAAPMRPRMAAKIRS
jgi:hypothetical protein